MLFLGSCTYQAQNQDLNPDLPDSKIQVHSAIPARTDGMGQRGYLEFILGFLTR